MTKHFNYDIECLLACNDEYGRFIGFASGQSKGEIGKSLKGTPYKPFGKTLILKIRKED